MCFRLRVGIEDQLSDAFSVAKVDEDEVAVVAVGVGPAGYCYYFTCVCRAGGGRNCVFFSA